MPTDSSLFIHSLARFRSRFPVHQITTWNERHAYDMALALRHAAWSLQAGLAQLSVIRQGSAIVHICIQSGSDYIDLFGTGAIERRDEQLFGSDEPLIPQSFESVDDLQAALESADYFTSYWPAAPDLAASIQQGIMMAAEDFSL